MEDAVAVELRTRSREEFPWAMGAIGRVVGQEISLEVGTIGRIPGR